MADNTRLNPGVSGDLMRDIDKSGVKTQVSVIDIGGSGAESLLAPGNPMPVSGTFFQTTQPISAASLPLPAGAAADSSLTTVNSNLVSILTGVNAVRKQEVYYGSWRTLLTTELNSLANNALTALGPAFDNTPGNSPDATHEAGYPLMDVEFVWSVPGGTFVANGALTFWFIGLGSDGSSYMYSAAAPTQGGRNIWVPPIATANRWMVRDIPAPQGTFKMLAQNNATGQSFGATANTVNVRFKTFEEV